MKKTITPFISGILVGVISTLIATLIIIIFNFAETEIVNIDEVPQAPRIEDIIFDNKGGVVIHLIEKYSFKNFGLKSGFIDNIEVKPIGLQITPQVEIIFIDKKPLHWREEKEIKCEFLIKLNRIQCYELYKKLGNSDKTHTEFRTYFYDNSGNNVYSGCLRLYLGNKSFKNR